MARVNVYDNAYSSEYTTIEVSSGKTINEAIGKQQSAENDIILCNGHLVDGDYILEENDIVCVRTFPSGGSVSSGFSAAWSGIKNFGSYVYETARDFLSDVGSFLKEKIIDWLGLDDLNETNTGDTSETESIPSIKGARNQSIKGHAIPIILGKSLFTPFYCGAPYTTIGGTDGEAQYYNACYIIGYAPLEISHLKLGELILTENNERITDGVIPISTEQGSAGRFIGKVSLEIKSGASEINLYPQKVVQESLQFQLLYPQGTTPLKAERFSSTYPHKIQVEISFNNLLRYNDKGEIQATSVGVLLGISFDGGASYEPFGEFGQCSSSRVINITNTAGTVIGTGTESVFTRAKNKAMRFVAERTLTWKEAKYLHEHGGDVAQIFIQRTNVDATDSKIQDKVYCTGIRTWTYDYDKSEEADAIIPERPVNDTRLRDKIVRLGIRITADSGFSDLNGTLNKLSAIVESKCRIWNGSSWSSQKKATSNPAAVALSVLQSPSLGQYSIPDDRIDLLKFGELYRFCEEHTGVTKGGDVILTPFRIGGAITAQKKLSEYINGILGVARSCLIMNGNLYSVLIDKPREYPVTVLNNHSFLDGGVSNSKSFQDLPDGYKVKFINERLSYSEDSIYVMVGNKTYDDTSAIIENAEVKWVTSPDLVWQSILYNHAKRKLRPEIWNRKIGIEGAIIEVGDLVSIQDDTIMVGIGDGGEIKEILYNNNRTKIIGIKIDCEIPISDINNRFGVKIVIANGIIAPSVMTIEVLSIEEEGYYDTFYFKYPFRVDDQLIPMAGDIISFGILDRITFDAMCSSKKDNGDGTYDLTLLPYDDGIYTADQGIIPEFNSKITDTQIIQGVYGLPVEYVTKSDYLSEILNIASGNFDVGAPDLVYNVKAVAQKDGINISFASPGAGLRNNIDYYIIELSSDMGETWERSYEQGETQGTYLFDRSTDGYPEANELDNWMVRIKAVNLYNQEGEFTEGTYVSTAKYGTWLLNAPIITTRIADRTITLVNALGVRADGREIYGTIRYRVQVQRPSTDMEWYKPATDLNPYPELNGSGEIISGNDDNYKDGSGYVLSENVYIQTMPLNGQGENNMGDTLYRFRVCTQNEAGVSEWAYVSATALCTSIRDLVKANETDKTRYITELSALSANIGSITQGAFGNDRNVWDLSTFVDDYGIQHYEGRMHVGGETQYLHVDPIIVNGVHTGEYEISFKVGNFEITSDAANVNGEFIVQENPHALDRTRITTTGTFYEHRNTVEYNIDGTQVDNWYVIAKQETSGLLSSILYSEQSLVITNMDIDERRLNGHDIGRPYLSENMVVYHFDTSIKDQHGNVAYEMEYLDEPPVLVGSGDNTDGGLIDFTPAILSVAPYSEIGKSLFGQYSLSHPLGSGAEWTVDFWIQYIWSENQVLFIAGNDSDKIQIIISTGEPNYNEPLDEEMQEGEHTPYNYEIFEHESLPYNVTLGEDVFCFHIGGQRQEFFRLSDIGIDFIPNSWMHFGIVMTADEVSLYINRTRRDFDRYNSYNENGAIVFNLDKNSFCLDELAIDTTVAEKFEDFAETTVNKIPFGALDYRQKHFILDASARTIFHTNLFDTDIFREKVLEIIKEYHS